MKMSAVQIVSLGLAMAACVWDVRTRRIPQLLTLGGAVAGVAFHIAISGWPAGVASLSGWAVGLLLFLIPFALGGLGAGDVKLLGALGAWLGAGQVIWLALYTGVAGGVLALAVALHSGYLRQALRNIYLLLMHWRLNGLRPLDDFTLEHGHGPRLAYALPILAGTVATLWLR
jgi:prepilin peptidase CpaA